jgi:Putative Flp pilus-assembly TadE/G-like
VIGVTFALSLPVMIGFGALALDASIWLAQKNAIQSAADAAAVSAITALGASDANAHVYNEVYTVAALNGFTNGQGGVKVYPYCPPNDGPNNGKSGYCEVVITQPQNLFLGAMFGSAPTVTGRSVAALPSNPACLLALDPSASKAIGLSGGSTDINAPACTVAAWSSNSDAIDMSGGASITAADLAYMGGYRTSGSSTVTATLEPSTKPANPYAGLSSHPIRDVLIHQLSR